MCGRFARHSTLEEFVKLIPGLAGGAKATLNPRYNIAPSQSLLLARNGEDTEREWVTLYWGLLPHWAKDTKARKPINARAETVDARPYFRSAFRRGRCLIAADGYYEWQKLPGGRKQPWYITLAAGGPFAFAGLWSRCQLADGPFESCCILTTEANEATRPIHDRMPVIVRAEDMALWLDPEIEQRAPLERILAPYPSDAMHAHPVSRLVNDPGNDSPRCIEPLPEGGPSAA